MKQKIVMETGAVMAGFFFGGPARQLVEYVAKGTLAAYATREIAEEYEAVFAKMQAHGEGRLSPKLLLPFTTRLYIIEPKTKGAFCRDPGNDKFISCALDANACCIFDNTKKLMTKRPNRALMVMTPDVFCQLLTLVAL